MSKLASLKKHTTVVADTGDIESVRNYKPQDATTNPSLILQAVQLPEHEGLATEAVSYAKQHGNSSSAETKDLAVDHLLVLFGRQILQLVPGRVSTEVDARLSFDAEASIERARGIIQQYQQFGIDRERILIKLASTWEGIQAAQVLESEGIHCNMTLMFCLAQAVASAEVKATLISPFVGRILDWYKKHEGVEGYPPEKDPGVRSVRTIYNYLKQHNFKTEVMGASFRNKEQILELAGADLLTISPKLLQELSADQGEVTPKLSIGTAREAEVPRIEINEASFRWLVNEDAMATEKLADGIRQFSADTIELEHLLHTKFGL